MFEAFEIIPAIDLLDRQVVRLEQGKRDRRTVYSDDPAGFVRQFQQAGAKRLHVVDLNGAFDGEFGNIDLVKAICTESGMRVELGGGIRTVAAVELAMSRGVDDVIIGTRALEDKAFISQLFEQFGENVIVGIDARDGAVVTRGWIEKSDVDALDFAREMVSLGCRRIIYTDVATDGMLSGPNLEALRRMAEAVPTCSVVASGGISSVEDLLAVKALELPNLVGAISGKALYDGRIDLALAVRKVQGSKGA